MACSHFLKTHTTRSASPLLLAIPLGSSYEKLWHSGLVSTLTQKLVIASIGWWSDLAPVIYVRNLDVLLCLSPIGPLLEVPIIQFFLSIYF